MSFAASDRASLPGWPQMSAVEPMCVAQSLADASAAIARLDQTSGSHPLAQALLFRTRLDAVRPMTAVDGDPWHLAANLEGLRLHMDPFLTMLDREDILDRARTALTLHQWIVAPDFDQEGEIQRTEAASARHALSRPRLIAAAEGFRMWIDAGETRARAGSNDPLLAQAPSPPSARAIDRCGGSPIRAELGGRSMASGLSAGPGAGGPQRPRSALHHGARVVCRPQCGAGRRRDSNHAAVVDVLAATPMLSATTLTGILKIAVKTSIQILDRLVAAGIVVEVTHRSKRRLFVLAGLAPIRDMVRPPYRAEPGRGRGRPRSEVEQAAPDTGPPPPPPLTPMERRACDYTALEEAMAHLDALARRTWRALVPGESMMLEGPVLSGDAFNRAEDVRE